MDANPFQTLQSSPHGSMHEDDNGDDQQEIDYELPEDVEMPAMEDLLKVTTAIDTELKQEEKTPIATRPTQELKRVSTHDPDMDILSQQTDLNDTQEEIQRLSTKVNLLEAKINKFLEMDTIMRTLSAQVKALTTEASALKQSNSALRSDFTQYQTLTSQTIKDVERRAKTHQLSLEPTVDVTVKEPPEVVEVTRETISSTDRPTAEAPKLKAPAFADLGDFF